MNEVKYVQKMKVEGCGLNIHLGKYLSVSGAVFIVQY